MLEDNVMIFINYTNIEYLINPEIWKKDTSIYLFINVDIE